MKTISKKEINTIVREFKALAKGKNIKIKLPVAVLPPLDMCVRWEDGCEANAVYDDYPSCEQLAVTYKIIEQEAAKQTKLYNIKISNFINKIIDLEKKYNLPDDQLWEDYLWTVC